MTSGPNRAAPTARIAVPYATSSVRQARHLLDQHLADLGVPTSVREDAVLVLSELVSNAIRHASPVPPGQILVCWAVDDHGVHLEITDGGGRTRPRPGTPGYSSVGGRGLDIVGQVSSRWGVQEQDSSVTVWADIRGADVRLPVDLPSPR